MKKFILSVLLITITSAVFISVYAKSKNETVLDDRKAAFAEIYKDLHTPSATQFICENGNVLSIEDNNVVWLYVWEDDQLSHQKTRFGDVDNSTMTFSWHDFNYAKNEATIKEISNFQAYAQSCLNSNSKSIVGTFTENPETQFFKD